MQTLEGLTSAVEIITEATDWDFIGFRENFKDITDVRNNVAGYHLMTPQYCYTADGEITSNTSGTTPTLYWSSLGQTWAMSWWAARTCLMRGGGWRRRSIP